MLLRLDRALYERLHVVAQVAGVSVAEWVRQAVLERLERQQR